MAALVLCKVRWKVTLEYKSLLKKINSYKTGNIMLALLKLIDTIITLYIYVIIASAVMSWLIAFNVINTRNQFVYSFSQAVNSLTEPVYRRIRQFLPPLGGLDLSPVIIILGLMFLRDLMWEIFTPGRF